MDDFTRAVVCLYDANASAEIKQSAQQFTESIRERFDVWKFCMERLFQAATNEGAARPESMFWCETTLNMFLEKRYNTLNEEEKRMLRQGLMTWVKDVYVNINVESYIRNKFAQVVVTMVKLEYPHQWPTVFRELLSLLNLGEKVVDLFLRILSSIDEEIVNRMMPHTKEEQIRHTEIKDAMRVDCIPDIVNSWATILQSGHVALTNQCLETMVNYIDWIDIGLVTTETFANLFFSFLSNVQFRTNACECLHMIVSKGMDHAAKLSLITNLQLPALITSIKFDSEEDESFAIAVSKLASAVAMRLHEALESFKTTDIAQAQAVHQILDMILPALFQIFSDDNDEVSAQALPFFSNRVAMFKKESLSQAETQQIATLLDIVKKKARYTDDFEFDPSKQTEYEAMLLEYRRDIFVLFKNLARAVPNLVKQYTMSFCAHQLNLFAQHGQSTPFPELEVALSMFYHLGEAVTEHVSHSPSDNEFAQTLKAVVGSNVSAHGHMSVQLAYLEVVSRYARLITHHQDLIIPVLQSFLDERGMRNPNATVSSRASYAFLRIVKTLQPHLHPFVETLYEHTKHILAFSLPNPHTIPEDSKASSDRMFIYESLGSILSNAKVDPQTRATVIEKILSPLLAQMEEIVNKELYKQDTEESKPFSVLLSNQISAIGYLSKGFSHSSGQSTHATDTFNRVLQVILKVFSAMPYDKRVREKVIFYLHRMVDLMTEEQLLQTFPDIISRLIATVYDAQQLKDVILLLNQLVFKCKQKAIPIADGMFLPLVDKVFQQIDNGKYQDLLGDMARISEEARIKIDIHKTYFSMVQVLLKFDCGDVFTSAKNSGSLNQVLQTIVQGCKHPSIHVVRMCFAILGLCVSRWAGSAGTNPTALPGFNNFVYETIVPVCFSVPLQSPEFDADDPACRQTLSDISGVLLAALKTCGDEFLLFMQQKFLPQLQLNQQEIASLLGSMQTAKNERQYREVLIALVRAKRS